MEQKRAAFLVRCSTNKQDYERQIEDLQCVADRFDFVVSEDNIFGEYITGKDDSTKKDRLSILRLKSAANEKKFDVILISEVSRLSRDSVSGRVYIREMCNLGIPIYFRDKMGWTINIETGEINEGFIRELGNYFDGAADYLKSLKTQVASGRRTQLRNNLMTIGKPAVGYRRRGGKDKKTKCEIIPDEELAPMVKEAFELYDQEGATLKSVSLIISAKYIRQAVGSIYKILRREAYATGSMVVSLNDPDRKNQEPELYTINFEPLISKELFDRVQKKLDENRASDHPYPDQQVRPLSRLIRCSSCGHAFSPRPRSGDKPGEKYRVINGVLQLSWLCCSRINNSCECSSHINLDDSKLTSIIWGLIKKELLPYADLNKEEREEKTFYAKRKLKEAEEHITLCRQEIDRTELLVKKAYKAYMSAPEVALDIALENYNQTLAQVQKTKDNAESEIQRLNNVIKRSKDTIEYYSKTEVSEEYVESIKDNDDEKRKFFTQLIEKIVPYASGRAKYVLEIFTVNDIYYVIMDATQRRYRIAYYFRVAYAIWQNSNEMKLTDRDPGAYFVIRNAVLLDVPPQITDVEKVEYAEAKDLCVLNGWAYKY